METPSARRGPTETDQSTTCTEKKHEKMGPNLSTPYCSPIKEILNAMEIGEIGRCNTSYGLSKLVTKVDTLTTTSPW